MRAQNVKSRHCASKHMSERGVYIAAVRLTLEGSNMRLAANVCAMFATALSFTSAFAAERSLTVLATAYNSTRAQTDHRPNTGAWGDRIEPGMKVIAVSRDLIKQGLKRGTKVTIAEMEGEWTVLDRTPSRYKNRIDIYMGVDVKAARQWGRRKVTVRWTE
jgi:3D (Asp-Asp-Asp) domain-containing protein